MSAALADQADREQIATALDDTLIVEAAAGTGKTTELVRRIVRVIETGRAEVTGIVAVTFTEKAAGELKLRLREALEEARGDCCSGSAERERLDRALGRLEEAQISTIHGFCADLLRERPVEARIDPLFTVLTEAQARRLYDDAFHTWLEDQLADPSEGVQRSLRRPSFGGFGAQADNDDGPIDRLRHAGWELIQWRDFDGEWQRPPFDRSARVSTRSFSCLNEFADLLDSPAYQYDTLLPGHWAARQLAERSVAPRSVAPATTIGSRRASSSSAAIASFNRRAKAAARIIAPAFLREDVWRARESCRAALAAFEADANADLAALLRQELRGCVRSV